MILREDLRQIDIEEAIRILHDNPHGYVYIHTYKDGIDKIRPAVFYICNNYPEAIDIDEYTSEQLLDILYTYHLYTQDENKGE